MRIFDCKKEAELAEIPAWQLHAPWNVNLHRVVREVLQLSDGNPLKPSETLIFPRFHKGESVTPPDSRVVI